VCAETTVTSESTTTESTTTPETTTSGQYLGIIQLYIGDNLNFETTSPNIIIIVSQSKYGLFIHDLHSVAAETTVTSESTTSVTETSTSTESTTTPETTTSGKRCFISQSLSYQSLLGIYKLAIMQSCYLITILEV